MTALDELIRQGFEPVTESEMKGAKIHLRSLSWKEHGGWLYAFVVDHELKYIGLANRVLRGRMDNYVHTKHSQTTRIRELIANALSKGSRVEIYGWRQSDEATLGAEEERLRALYRPPWNRR